MKRALVIGLVLLLLLGGGWWLWRSQTPAFSDAELQAFSALRVTGLGVLENEKPEASLDGFATLASAFPDQPLGHRNLAVARLMVLQNRSRDAEPEEWNAAYEDARKAITALLQVEPEAAEAHVLAARLALAAEDIEEATTHFEKAIEYAPPDATAPIWFEWYLATQYATAEPQQQAAQKAIREAYDADPTNSAIVLELLTVQLEAEDPEIASTLQQARETLAPLDAAVLQRVRVSLLELIDNAIQAAEQQDWNVTNRWVRMLINVVRPEELVRSDLARADRNILEFVLVDFPPEFYDEFELKRVDPAEPIAVQFAPAQETPFPTDDRVLDSAVADFNLDGIPDLIVLSENQVAVWARNDLDAAWEKIVTLATTKTYQSLAVADLDADADNTTGSDDAAALRPTADLDLILFGEAGWKIFENRREEDGRVLVEVEIEGNDDAGIKTLELGDLDLDGDLDLFVAAAEGISIWRNLDELQFETWPMEALIGAAGLRPDQAIVVDWDRDIDLDVLLAAGGGHPAGVLENLRHSKLVWRPFADKFQLPSDASRFALDDVDGNASWDILWFGSAGRGVVTTRTPVAGRVVAGSAEAIESTPTELLTHFDYDNDGLRDVLLLSDGEPRLLRHLGGGQYETQTGILPEGIGSLTGADAADIDQDGDLDLILRRDGELQVLNNEGGNSNNWLNVLLLAQQVKGSNAQASGRVNQYGLGSLLELKNGTTYQPRVVKSTTTHFGLGDQDAADVIRIVWTNGVPQNIIEPAGNQLVTEQQTLKGSCPYLYAWSGNQFEFVTDLLWAAPLGLQTPAGTIAPDRPWEYLKIEGDALQPRDGEYRLQITEELWEAAYFDHVALVAVDHPRDVDIFTNEKVGPAAIAEPKLHFVEQPRHPRSATDSQGRDVMEWITSRDDRYLKAYEEKYFQGYVSEHHVEIDLGEFAADDQVTLFLTGWIYPTDTSLNVRLAQNDSLPGPRPPYLLAPDANGDWREVKSFIGFPGGKTKTIAIDISDVFPTDDHRLRIATSSEIYWDEIFFTINPPKSEVRRHPLSLKAAHLHARGVSKRLPHPGHGPERYDYQHVTQTPAWPAMKGNFTRFGDVRELITSVDDRLVVMGTGDELNLAFAVPDADVPEGWKRDFVLHCWGWDKDADLNTIYGETAEPLPFAGMQSYPAAADASRPQTDAYRQYLEHYQTRRQIDADFRNYIRDYVRQ